MEIFPKALLRIGGEPFNLLHNLQANNAIKKCNKVFELDEKLNQSIAFLSENVYKEISALSNKDDQNILLNLRRNVFNKRSISVEERAQAKTLLSEKSANELDTYCATLNEKEGIIVEYEHAFKKETADIRSNLQKLCQNEVFQKGLLLSSQVLLNNIESFVKKHPNDFKKKDIQTEQGLLKYLTRMLAKTSPFSTFTNLAIAEINNESPTAISTAPNITSHVCVNNMLFSYLKTILAKLPIMYKAVTVRLNPSLQASDKEYLYLINSNNVESFQRVEASPLIDLFLDEIKNSKEDIAFGDVIKNIVKADVIDADEEGLTAFLLQIIDFGLIEMDFGVSGLDAFWDKTLIKQLEKHRDTSPLFNQLIDALKQIREHANLYEKGDVLERLKHIKESHTCLKNICLVLHEAAGLPAEERLPDHDYEKILRQRVEDIKAKAMRGEKIIPDEFKKENHTHFHFKPEQMFFEDTTNDIKINLPENEVKALAQEVQNMFESLVAFEAYEPDQLKMKHFFKTKYPNKKIDLFTFYEDYYKEFKAAELDYKEALENHHENKTEGEIPEKPEALKVHAADSLLEKQTKWATAYSENIWDANEKDVLYLDLNKVHALNKTYFPNSTFPKENSSGVFFQFFKEDGTLKAVCNNLFQGYGRLLSRFVHLFDEKILNLILEYNNKYAHLGKMAEATDSSYFNANIHPCLMPYEARIPGGHNTLPFEKQIEISDIELVFDESINELKLQEKKNGTRLFFFDLCFQSPNTRSKLFQLMCQFTMAKFYNNFVFLKPIQNAMLGNLEKPEILVLPRVCIKNVVLSRKTWVIPKKSIPLKLANESDWAYFCKLNSWRKKQGIGVQAFYFVNSPEFKGVKSKNAGKTNRDDYKPQFMDFSNPLMVNLFLKAIEKVPFMLKIEEMLPGPDDMLEINGNRYVTEYLVQWYT